MHNRPLSPPFGVRSLVRCVLKSNPFDTLDQRPLPFHLGINENTDFERKNQCRNSEIVPIRAGVRVKVVDTLRMMVMKKKEERIIKRLLS